MRLATTLALAMALHVGPANAAETVRGMYVEAPAPVVVAPQTFVAVKAVTARPEALLGWKVTKGAHGGVELDGLCVVGVRHAVDDGRGNAKSRTALLVDKRANAAQQAALVDLIKSLAGQALGDVGAIETAPIDLRVGEGCAMGYVVLNAGDITLRTRRMEEADWAAAKARGVGEVRPSSSVHYNYTAATVDWSCAARARESEGTARDPSSARAGLPTTACVGGFSR